MQTQFIEANKKYKEQDYQICRLMLAECLDAQYRESDCLNNIANAFRQEYLQSVHKYLVGEVKALPVSKDSKGAIKYYEEAIEIEPNHVNANFNFGVYLSQKPKHSDNQRALKYLSTAVSLDETNSLFRYHLAKCKARLFDDDGALREYSMAISLDKNNREAWIERGQLYLFLDDRINALADFNKAVILFPEWEVPLLERGKMKSDAQNHTGALLDFSQGLSTNPESWPLYSHRSYVFNQLFEQFSLQEFSSLAQEDKRDETYYFDNKGLDLFSDREFVPDLRLRHCE